MEGKSVAPVFKYLILAISFLLFSLKVFQYERGNGLGSKYYRYVHKLTGKSYHSLVQAVANGCKTIPEVLD